MSVYHQLPRNCTVAQWVEKLCSMVCECAIRGTYEIGDRQTCKFSVLEILICF